MPRVRWTASLPAACAVAVLLAAHPRTALGGNASYIGVAGVTKDGQHYAVFHDSDGIYGACGLTTAAPRPSYEAPSPLSATAGCVDANRQLLPLGAWKWHRRPAQVAELRAFHRDQVSNAPARIVKDRDTRVIRMEVLQRGRWLPIAADEGSGLTEVPLEQRYGSPETTETGTWRAITGFVRVDKGYLIRLTRTQTLLFWDEVVAISELEVENVAGRRARAQRTASAATTLLRDQRASRSGVFISTAAGPINQIVRKRKRAAAAREALRLWEIAAAYGALTESDVRDAVWLIAWIDAPTRRLQALRWYLGIRDSAARALVHELKQDPDTAWLGAHLERSSDPLRKLPDVAGTVLTDADLSSVSDDELRWLHLAQWAAQGGYRFADPTIHEYFAQFPWYCPIPQREWARYRTKAFMTNPDTRLLRSDRAAIPSGARRQSLEALLRAERARGLSPPAQSLAGSP